MSISDAAPLTPGCLPDIHLPGIRDQVTWSFPLQPQREQSNTLAGSADRRRRRFERPFARNLEPLVCIQFPTPISLDQPQCDIRYQCWSVGTVEDCNDGFARILGFRKAGEMLGKITRDLFPDGAEDLDCLRAGGRLDVCLLRKGHRRWHRFRFSPVIEGKRLIGLWAVIIDITAVKRLQENYRALAAERDRILERERKRISAEIHDELGQQLGALRLALSAQVLGQVLLEPQQLVLELDRAIHSVRRIATELRPPVLDHFGLAAAVEWQTREFARASGVRCVAHIDPDIAVNEEQTLAIFRILQESLTNIGKHAHARNVEVVLASGDDGVSLRVADDGRGFDVSSLDCYSGIGLLGMRERAIAVEGVLTVSHPVGGGTVVEAQLTKTVGNFL